VITELSEEQGRADIILKGSADYGRPTFLFDSIAQVDGAIRQTVRPEELPDDVVVAIAKRALLGAAN
jgi:hypothetical protein